MSCHGLDQGYYCRPHPQLPTTGLLLCGLRCKDKYFYAITKVAGTEKVKLSCEFTDSLRGVV